METQSEQRCRRLFVASIVYAKNRKKRFLWERRMKLPYINLSYQLKMLPSDLCPLSHTIAKPLTTPNRAQVHIGGISVGSWNCRKCLLGGCKRTVLRTRKYFFPFFAVAIVIAVVVLAPLSSAPRMRIQFNRGWWWWWWRWKAPSG